VRDRLMTLGRLTTYADRIGAVDAATVAAQLRLAQHGVLYVDGGWQQIVDALFEPVAPTFVREKVTGVDVRDDGVVVTSARGPRRFDFAVLALPYAKAARLAGSLAPSCPGAPVRISALDVVLAERPPGALPLVLGVDRAVYFGDRSRYADDGGVVMHVVSYDRARREELEEVLDVAVPSWREVAQARRFLPAIGVADCLPADRVPARWHERLVGVGDWTTTARDTFLADAVAASAAEAATQVLAYLDRGRRRVS
jgi:hypothetical protein